jgi:hypothetical protein
MSIAFLHYSTQKDTHTQLSQDFSEDFINAQLYTICLEMQCATSLKVRAL